MTAGATFYISGPTLGHVPEAFHTHGKDPCWIVTLVSGSRASQPRHRSSQIRVDGMQPSAPKSVSLASLVAGDDRVRGAHRQHQSTFSTIETDQKTGAQTGAQFARRICILWILKSASVSSAPH